AQQRLPQADRSIDRLTIIKFDARIDRNTAFAAILRSPTAVGGKVFERETHRVEKFVATGARLILAMQRLLLTHAQDLSRLAGCVFQWRNVWRRFRRRGAENIVEYPHASFDR